MLRKWNRIWLLNSTLVNREGIVKSPLNFQRAFYFLKKVINPNAKGIVAVRMDILQLIGGG